MNRIDRYISGLFWGYFLGGLLIFTTIFLAVDAMSTMVSYKGVEASVWIHYYAYLLPEVLHKLLPVSCLLGTIATLATLNRSNELVALFASGMSLIRVTGSVLLWVLLISIAAYAFSDRVLPAVSKNKNFIFYSEIKKNPSLYQTVKTNKIWYRSKNAIFNIKTLSPEGDRASGLTLYFFDEHWDLLQMITATDVEMHGAQWNLVKGSVTVFTRDSSFPLTSQFAKKSIIMSEDANDLKSTGQTSDMLSQSELSRFINKNKEAGLDTINYEVDYHAKFSFALAGLVMCLLGIPFSVSSSRSGGMMLNVGIGLGLVFVYWIFYSSGLNLGKHGALKPVLAAWLPNLFFVGAALFTIRRKNA